MSHHKTILPEAEQPTNEEAHTPKLKRKPICLQATTHVPWFVSNKFWDCRGLTVPFN
jgi:hypothetical protein